MKAFRFLIQVIHGAAIALDYGAAMLLWWRVSDPMTLSSHAGLATRNPTSDIDNRILRGLAKLLNAIDPGHTDAAIAADIERCQTSLKRLQAPNEIL